MYDNNIRITINEKFQNILYSFNIHNVPIVESNNL